MYNDKSYTVTGISLDLFSLENHVENRQELSWSLHTYLSDVTVGVNCTCTQGKAHTALLDLLIHLSKTQSSHPPRHFLQVASDLRLCCYWPLWSCQSGHSYVGGGVLPIWSLLRGGVLWIEKCIPPCPQAFDSSRAAFDLLVRQCHSPKDSLTAPTRGGWELPCTIAEQHGYFCKSYI